MSEMNLILVEDQEQDRETCRNAVIDFEEDNDCTIKLQEFNNVSEALSALRKSYYDGAIIDMKLADQGGEGNQVIELIRDSFRRIPVVIMTGTPDVAETDGFPLVKLGKKGEVQYKDIINELWNIYNTGLTRILGGKGEIEKNLNRIFIENLLPHRHKWIEYGLEDSTRTEKALLRHALNHLSQILDDDVNKCYPEELYIYPTVSDRINTGVIVKSKTTDDYYIVMNPACDLAERDNGGCNTDRALLAKIDSVDTFLNDELSRRKIRKPDLAELTEKQKRDVIKETRKHKKLYYHWLPETGYFSGGFINFRKIATHTEEEFTENFETPLCQISSPFLKDIVSRFSSYYARQGQPDIDYDKVEVRI